MLVERLLVDQFVLLHSSDFLLRFSKEKDKAIIICPLFQRVCALSGNGYLKSNKRIAKNLYTLQVSGICVTNLLRSEHHGS